jgi:subtilase family serine protease
MAQDQGLVNGSLSLLCRLFQQANAEGITVLTPATPLGCTSSSINPLSASAVSPYVTATGGTGFNEGPGTYWDASGSAISYIPEVPATGLSGGASVFNTKPSWQAGLDVPNDRARDIPDVSFFAGGGRYGEGYFAATWPWGDRDDPCACELEVGGAELTSANLAGLVAMLVQQTGQRQGNINPALYTLASFSTDAFHSAPQGSPGYGVTTGLGSPDVANLFREWPGNFQISVSPATFTVARGSSGTATTTVTRFDIVQFGLSAEAYTKKAADPTQSARGIGLEGRNRNYLASVVSTATTTRMTTTTAATRTASASTVPARCTIVWRSRSAIVRSRWRTVTWSGRSAIPRCVRCAVVVPRRGSRWRTIPVVVILLS